MKRCVTVIIEDDCDRRDEIRLIPRFGPIVEQRLDKPKATRKHFCVPAKMKGELMAAFTMTNTQQVEVTIAAKDKRGQPANFDGVPEWMTDNSDVLTLEPSEDGHSCLIKAAGMVGTAKVQVSVDADLTENSRPIMGMLDVTITAGEAQIVELVAGTPTEQEEPE